MKKLTIIGDVHHKYQQYYNIASKAERSFQVGDFSTSYSDWERLHYSDLNPEHHKVGQGNHDNHNLLVNSPPAHFAGRYGWVRIPDCQPFYWIGGALSVDMVYRMGEWYSDPKEEKKTWWPNEQLGLMEMVRLLEDIRFANPDVIVAHTAPSVFIDEMAPNGSSLLESYGWGRHYHDTTTELLDAVFNMCKPRLFVCGHFHKAFQKYINKTQFVCLPELGTFEL